MARLRLALVRWGPALVWMAAIFISSATPATKLPRFGGLDYAVKKGGHFVAYGILALAYRRALGTPKSGLIATWLLAVAYALLDEFHQSFVPGRHPSLIDALIYDGGGAMAALWIGRMLARGRQPPVR